MEGCVRLMFESMLQKEYKNINGLERVDHIMLDFQRNEKNEHELNNEYIKKEYRTIHQKCHYKEDKVVLGLYEEDQ